MADETPYSNELRLPVSITLPRTPRLTPEGRPWPVDETGRDWPSRRGRPVYPVTRLPHGQAPGTGHAPPSSDRRTLMELFAAMDAAMMAEGRHAAASIAARERRQAAANQAVGAQQSDPATADGHAPVDDIPEKPPYDVAGKDPVAPSAPTPLPPGYYPAPGDINLLARTIFSEGSNTQEAYPALAWVIVNRINSKAYGSSDTLAGVVFQAKQFQGVATATYPGNDPWRLSADPNQMTGPNRDSWNEAMTVATQILTGKSKDPTRGATNFYHEHPGRLEAAIKSGQLIELSKQGDWHFLGPKS